MDIRHAATIEAKATPSNYARFIKNIRTGKQDQPDFARRAEVQKVLDAVIASDVKGSSVKV